MSGAGDIRLVCHRVGASSPTGTDREPFRIGSPVAIRRCGATPSAVAEEEFRACLAYDRDDKSSAAVVKPL